MSDTKENHMLDKSTLQLYLDSRCQREGYDLEKQVQKTLDLCDNNMADSRICNLLCRSVEEGSALLTDYMICSGVSAAGLKTSSGDTLLHHAFAHYPKKHGLAKSLLQAGSCINLDDRSDMHCDTLATNIVQRGSTKTLQVLFDAGYKLTYNMNDLLAIATKRELIGMARLLIVHGAEVTDLAKAMVQDNPEFVKLFRTTFSIFIETKDIFGDRTVTVINKRDKNAAIAEAREWLDSQSI